MRANTPEAGDFVRQDFYRQRDAEEVLYYASLQHVATGRFYAVARGWFKSWRGQEIQEVDVSSACARLNPNLDPGFATLGEAVDDYEARNPFKK